MKSLKKASIFTPLGGQVSTKVGCSVPSPTTTALTGLDTRPPEHPVEKASMVLIQPHRSYAFRYSKDFHKRTKHFCEITHAGSIDDYLKSK